MPKKITLAEPTSIIIDLSEDPEFEKFLSVQCKNTRNTYTAFLRRLKEFTPESGAEILEHREEWITRIFEFGQWLKSQGYAGTTIQSCLGCVRGFFASNRKPLEFTKSERQKLRKRSRSTEDLARAQC
jgi:site-specific recombinase XerD